MYDNFFLKQIIKEELKVRKLCKRVSIIMCFVLITLVVGTVPIRASSTADPILGQIILFPYGSAPLGWVECDGRTMYRVQNQALYSLIGTTFGGNGTTTFNIPDLRNKEPITGTKYYMATMGLYGVDNATPAIGEVCLFPDSMFRESTMWKLCDGSVLSISEYSSLYATIGVNYGGNNSTNFNIPNLSTKNPISGLHYYIAVDGAFPTMVTGIENDALLGSIELYAFSYVPGGTYYCNGQTIPTNQNGSLYSLIGTTFGGNGSYFGIPNLVFKVPSSNMKYCMRNTGLYPSFN